MMKTTKNLKVNDLFKIAGGKNTIYVVTNVDYRPAGTGHGPCDVYPAYHEVTAAAVLLDDASSDGALMLIEDLTMASSDVLEDVGHVELGRKITFRNGTKKVTKVGRAKVKTVVTIAKLF